MNDYTLVCCLLMVVGGFAALLTSLEVQLKVENAEKNGTVFQKKLQQSQYCINVQNDVKVILGKEKETTVDFLVFTNKEILCVDYFACEGFVYGEEVARVWWCVDEGKRKIKFRNPMELAYYQSEAIKRRLQKAKTRKIIVKPVIIFPNGANLSYVEKLSDEIEIMNENDFFKYIAENNGATVLRQNQCENLAKAICKTTEW